MVQEMNKTKGASAVADELPWGFDRRVTGGGTRSPRPRQVTVYPCRPEGLARPIRASVCDASPTGIGLTCLGRLAVGSRFVLRIAQGNGTPLLQVYHVTRCRDAGGGACQIGAVFDQAFVGTCPVTRPACTPAPAAC
jgi:hypothetical protein